MATLFDKGLFNYEDTITKYWPEFAQNGKENVKICDVLRHESGLAYFKGQAHGVFLRISRIGIYKTFLPNMYCVIVVQMLKTDKKCIFSPIRIFFFQLINIVIYW